MQKTDCKNEIYAKNWVSRTWTKKVNTGSKSTARSKSTVNLEKVNSQIPRVKGWRQRLTQASDISNGASKGWRGWRQQAREGAWELVGARDGAWSEAIARGGAWGVWSAEQNLWVACGGAYNLRRHRGFHEFVDRRKMIFVVPSKP